MYNGSERNPIRTCHVALKDTLYKDLGSDIDVDEGNEDHRILVQPHHSKHTTNSCTSSNNSTSSLDVAT